jgi:hypothetical protein
VQPYGHESYRQRRFDMHPIRHATVPHPRKDRNGIKNKILPTVGRKVLGCLVIRRKSEGEDFVRQTDPITAGTAANLTA